MKIRLLFFVFAFFVGTTVNSQNSFTDLVRSGDSIYLKNKDYEKAILIYNSCLDSVILQNAENTKVHLSILKRLVNIYLDIGRKNETILYSKEYTRVYKAIYGKYDSSCINYFVNIALRHAEQQDYPNAISYCDTLLPLIKDSYGENSNFYYA